MNPPTHAPRRLLTVGLTGALLGLGLTAPVQSHAFCGFYVSGAEAKLYNDATMVVMMRDGQRTVLAMQNHYQGPPQDFALVIPVPTVLHEGDVQTLPRGVFDRVDKLAAPRLVEYWEQDPCAVADPDPADGRGVPAGVAGGVPDPVAGVKVEAQFNVDEYQIVILSAEDSTALDTWLRANEYNIPSMAEQLLRPYVAAGSKFFVAKVDPSKIAKPADGSQRIELSPLRFHYDAEQFSLPLRLGLINANGPQDLLVHILAPNQRYRAANYPNVTIPTNLVVLDQTRERFPEFYVSLFDHTLGRAPTAVVTEYAWSAGSCDPCPEPPLDLDELITLGAALLPSYANALAPATTAEAKLAQRRLPRDFVLTRLHARYDASSLGEDLVFEAAPALVGGRGMPDRAGALPPDVEQVGDHNSFQARYAILHPWASGVSCAQPQRGLWGGPHDNGPSAPTLARELAFVPRDAKLSEYVSTSAHAALGLAGPPTPILAPTAASDPAPMTSPAAKQPAANRPGCSCDTNSNSGPLASLLALAGLLGFRRKHPTCRSSRTT
ncbi:DUF2330 domain-containing protein [Enhygromyxa salina]|nr:DUF2330 domain-containing protein [Enhygromyxa salina]